MSDLTKGVLIGMAAWAAVDLLCVALWALRGW